MRLFGDGDDLRQCHESFAMPIEVRFDPIRSELDEVALPRKTDHAVLTLHCIEKTFALNVDLLTWNRFECAAGLNLSRHVDKAFACALLQAWANKLRQRFFAGREYEYGSVRRLAQMPGRCG